MKNWGLTLPVKHRTHLKLNRSDTQNNTPRTMTHHISPQSTLSTSQTHIDPSAQNSIHQELHSLHCRLLTVEQSQSQTHSLNKQLERALEALQRSERSNPYIEKSEETRIEWKGELRVIENRVKDLHRQFKTFEQEARTKLNEDVVQVSDLQRLYEAITSETNTKIETFSYGIQEAIDSVTQTSNELHSKLIEKITSLEHQDCGGKLRKLQESLIGRMDEFRNEMRKSSRETAWTQEQIQRAVAVSLETSFGNLLTQRLYKQITDRLKKSLKRRDLRLAKKLQELERRLGELETLDPCTKLASFTSDTPNITFGEEEAVESFEEMVVDETQLHSLVASIIQDFISTEVESGHQRLEQVIKRVHL